MQKQIPGDARPGVVVLFGSGETSPSGRKAFDHIFRRLPAAPKIALLETPAGFELNSARVIDRVGEFISEKLQNYKPQIEIIAARARGTWNSPDNPEIVAPMLAADLIFMGPGSPTYAVRQLENSLAWQMILARHRLGAVLALASAATIAVSAQALPVYEIYKVGEDPHWKKGLDLFAHYGLPLIFIPHWNNNDGGLELDTSRCYIGQKRFQDLLAMLPPDQTVIGIDEKTALIIDLVAGRGEVIGLGGVTIVQSGHYHRGGSSFPLSECCPFEIPDSFSGFTAQVWQQALESQARLQADIDQKKNQELIIPVEIQHFAELRLAARQRKDWAAADVYREKIITLGWTIRDLPDGTQELMLKEN